MPDIYFKSVPFSKEDVTLALESGVDGIITEAEHVEGVRSLALCDVRAEADMPSVGLGSKAEEESIASRIAGGERLVLEMCIRDRSWTGSYARWRRSPARKPPGARRRRWNRRP